MAESVHTARWLQHVDRSLFDVHIFPSKDLGYINEDIKDATVHHYFSWRGFSRHTSVKTKAIFLPFKLLFSVCRYIVQSKFPNYKNRQLLKLIKTLKPDIIHSMEFQEVSAFVLLAKMEHGDGFPKWIATNWGSDIYLFGRLEKHKELIKEILSNCDYYSCECERDVELAHQYGFKKDVLPVFPNSGGFDIDFVGRLREQTKTSSRKNIIVKGYQSWCGRALNVLEALKKIADVLRDKDITVYFYYVSYDMEIAIELFSKEHGVKTEIIPFGSSHNKMLEYFASARIYVGLSISDAISTSFLEAMATGAFAVQSDTACANEWAKDAESAFFVAPNDIERTAECILFALQNDDFVDSASEINFETISARADSRQLGAKINKIYTMIVN